MNTGNRYVGHAHIKDTREKPYICHCGAAFTRPDLLKRHRGLVHVDEEGAIAVSSSNVGHTWPSQERLTNDASQWGNHRTVDPGTLTSRWLLLRRQL